MIEGALLGPQRLAPTITDALDAFGVQGPLALITAGWQEREPEDEELRAACGGRETINLRLYARWEQVLQEDQDFTAAHRARQDRLRRLQELYSLRLDQGMGAARHLLAMSPDEMDPDLLMPEQADAVEIVRALDAHHLGRIREIHAAFEAQIDTATRPVIAPHREAIRETLAGCDALLVAGGHVAVLINRLRQFGIAEALTTQRLFAWSAGAMAVSERLVLFHDLPPQGYGHAEVLDVGLGLIRGVVPLPHARRRLRLTDPTRVALMARRFAPLLCCPLDEGEALHVRAGQLMAGAAARRLEASGEVRAFAPDARLAPA